MSSVVIGAKRSAMSAEDVGKIQNFYAGTSAASRQCLSYQYMVEFGCMKGSAGLAWW